MNVAIRVDASVVMGTGHFMRCLTLADELRRGGDHVRFLCRALPDFLERLLRGSGHTLQRLEKMAREPEAGPVLSHASWLDVSQAQDAAQSDAALVDRDWDWLVVDHYALDARWESRLRSRAARTLCFDDLADRMHDCDLLLDQNIQSLPDPYAGRVPSGCTQLLGTAYVQLRPEFARLRPAAIAAPRPPRLHIFLGGTDPAGATVLALQALEQLPELEADVVLGENSPSRPAVEALCRTLPRVALHIQVREMAQLLARATMAIGAGGSASWERCCLGVPTLVMSIAQNQQPGCRALAAARAAINLGGLDRIEPGGLANLIRRVQQRPRLLAQMSRRAAVLVDGAGASRVADRMRQMACRTARGMGKVLP